MPPNLGEADRSLPLVERILTARGMLEPEIDAFRTPSLNQLHDPCLLPDIDNAAERILRALARDERIVIWGDYDVDGITATAILFHLLKAIHPAARVATFIPHRLEEGYGLNVDGVRELRRNGADLIVTVDCGITAVEPARAAREVGLDLIITDHHTPPAGESDLPPALAIIHARRPGSRYPFADLSGAGVAFKLAWRLATLHAGNERVGDALQQTLLHLLPLAALGTIADVMPLLGENRVIATFGLRLIRQTPVVGLRALIEATDLMNEQIDCEKVGFILAPHLNACGRMGHAREAVHLLTEAGPDEALSIARRLAAMNRERRQTERAIFDRAVTLAEDSDMTGDGRRAIVLADESWHPGVVGIVCSRLVDRYCRPAVLMQRGKDQCKGSARSIEGYSIAAALTDCADLLLTHGGHDMAAGLSIATGNLARFIESFIEHANARIEVDQLTPCLRIDCVADLEELTVETVRRLQGLSPFGRGNPRPVVCLPQVRVAAHPRQIGRDGRHFFMPVDRDDAGRRNAIRTLWWNGSRFAPEFAPGMRIDLAVEPKINEWNGRTTVEAIIRDARYARPDCSG